MEDSTPMLRPEWADEDDYESVDIFSYEDPFFAAIDVETGGRIVFRLSKITLISRHDKVARIHLEGMGPFSSAIALETADLLEGLLASYSGVIDLDKKTFINLGD